jgi:hypothetical protein
MRLCSFGQADRWDAENEIDSNRLVITSVMQILRITYHASV